MKIHKKKIKFTSIILLITLVLLTSISLYSCIFHQPLRPSGVFESDITEKNGYELRFLVKFQENDFSRNISSGTVDYAFQQRKKNEQEWKTVKIDTGYKFEVDNTGGKNTVNYVKTPSASGEFRGYVKNDIIDIVMGENIYEVERKHYKYSNGEWDGYVINKSSDAFPDKVDDLSKAE